jgi:hypothetical protein
MNSYTCIAYKLKKNKSGNSFCGISVFMFKLKQPIHQAMEYAQEYLKNIKDDKYAYEYKYFYQFSELIEVK